MPFPLYDDCTGIPYMDDMCGDEALYHISGMGVGWWGAV